MSRRLAELAAHIVSRVLPTVASFAVGFLFLGDMQSFLSSLSGRPAELIAHIACNLLPTVACKCLFAVGFLLGASRLLFLRHLQSLLLI